MNKTICSLFNHNPSVESTENLPGQSFRYVLTCRCGEHTLKSVPLHDNDLLANIELTSRNFPVDDNYSN